MADTESYIWQSVFPESPRRRPCHRSRQAACRYRGQIYVYGGRDSNTTLRDFWRYDTATNIWTRLECGGETPPPLQEHTMVADRGCLFIFGGELGYGSCGETPLWIYDIPEQKWEKPVIGSEVMTPTGRRGHTAVVWHGGMHVYGGYIDLKGSSGEMWTLDLETRWWHLSVDAQLDNISPCPRHWHSAVVHGSNMWVYGGLNNLLPLRDLWKWNFESRTWIRVKSRSSPGFLHGHSAVCVANSMVIFGGEDGEGAFRKDLWRFDFGSGTWHSVTPNRRVTPTSCTRHVLISLPSNQMEESRLYPSAVDPRPQPDPRPQSAPTQAHPSSQQPNGALSTPKGHLADFFVIRPHSSPPVMANDRHNTVHRFTNRVHPSPTENTNPNPNLGFELNDENGCDKNERSAPTDYENSTNFCFGEAGTKMEGGRWAMAKDAAIYGTWTENGRWADLSSTLHEQCNEKDQTTSNILTSEESTVEHFHGDDVSKLSRHDMQKSNASLRSHKWILEDVPSEPSSPVQTTTDRKHEQIATSTNIECACKSSDLLSFEMDSSKSDKMCSNLPEIDLTRLSQNDISFPRDILRGQASCKFCSTFMEHPYAFKKSCSCFDTEQTSVSECLTEQNPQEPKNLVERTSPSKADLFRVGHLNKVGDFSQSSSIKTEGVHVDKQNLLISNEEKPLVTFVNNAFVSSFEDLTCNVTCKVNTLDTTESKTVNQSDGVYKATSQSETALYSPTGQVYPSNQSQPPLLTVNGTTDQSDAGNHLIHQSRPKQFESVSQHNVILVKPTNDKMLEMSAEEYSKVIYSPNLKIQKFSNLGSSDECNNKRSKLHVRSQTLNSLADKSCGDIQRPRTLGLKSDYFSGKHPEQKTVSCDKKDKWTWPVFLYLMGGEETGSCSLHQNSSPMSVWKCCIVQGKPTENEIQHLLSRY